MRTGRSIVISTILALGAAGSILAGSAAPDLASEAAKIDLKPGKYVFYCDILGHRAQGMEGTLTVN
jgi:hypothetical protein